MTLSPFARLPNSMYPGKLVSDYFDFLWMTADTRVGWQRLRRIADIRLPSVVTSKAAINVHLKTGH